MLLLLCVLSNRLKFLHVVLLQGAKSDSSSFHIRLTYSQASDEAQGLSETKHERKKRKTGRSMFFELLVVHL